MVEGSPLKAEETKKKRMAQGKAMGIEALLRWGTEIGICDFTPSLIPPSPSSSCLGYSLFASHFPDAGGRGLGAARDLKKGELVLRVPRTALLTSDSVVRDEKIACCIKRYPHLSSTQILAVCLLAEVGKGKSSKWYPYLLQLPQYYSTLANFTDYEIKSFQLEDTIWVAEKAVKKAKSDWEEVITLMKEMQLKPQLLTLKSWLWASATVSSRTLHIPWDSAGCLCPVGDLFNYAAPDDEAIDNFNLRLTDGGYEEDTASYCFYARKKYEQGEQVLLGYGTYTNLELLEHYGFLLHNNPNEKVFIQLDTAIFTVSTWPNDSLYIQQDGIPSFALLRCLRLWATPVNRRRVIGHLIHSGNLVSVENEVMIMNWLMKNCDKILGKIPTTIEIDDELLILLDKFQNNSTCLKLVDSSSSKVEIREFFQAHGLEHEAVTWSELPVRVQKSLERWKLAVRWRLIYKKTLLRCISHCKDRICELSSQRGLLREVDQT
ncbi:Protein SET DOMAIN GROUP 40 [Ananas comosus]|uniref:Protein SET DOMAIN GROUP 40 n=1 Tax=Ananas comosus TaxID=4615 RepID=A0A199UKH2_ANACO|nr:Protein SET DOMAIN GROUP 40 [Ananas comosus]